MKKDSLIQICNQIAIDMEKDARDFDGRPFDGKTVAEYMAYQGAAIKALSDVLKTVIENLK